MLVQGLPGPSVLLCSPPYPHTRARTNATQARAKEDARALRATTASTCLVIARLLEAGADPNDRTLTEITDPATGGPVRFSSALLAALEYGMDDLAVLVHLHGGQLPPSGPAGGSAPSPSPSPTAGSGRLAASSARSSPRMKPSGLRPNTSR